MNTFNFMRYTSVESSDTYFLQAFTDIYLKGEQIDLDPTYSKGIFYKDFQEPRLKSDIKPQGKDVIRSDCRELKYIKDSTIKSIVFDPPFLFRNRKAENRDIISNRFAYFRTYDELYEMYKESLKEFYRILKPRGYIFFKCQDMTDGSGSRPFFDTHQDTIKMARDLNFSLRDIGILVNRGRIIRKAKQQGCLRKVHSYWLVFRKEL